MIQAVVDIVEGILWILSVKLKVCFYLLADSQHLLLTKRQANYLYPHG